MTARDRLATALAPELLAALEQLVDERVAAAIADPERDGEGARSAYNGGTAESGPGAADTARGPDTGGSAPMTSSSYGAASRKPVHSGEWRVPGLFERTLANGSTVYEASMRLAGSMPAAPARRDH